MGKIKLKKELNLNDSEAKTLFEEYHQRVLFVKKLSEEISSFATENELLYTLYDRFCRFNKWETKNKTWNPDLQRYDKVETCLQNSKQEKDLN